jgi:putative ABC transport system permease protein
MLRATQTSVVAHERERSRATRKPLWQRIYLDLWLVLPVAYATYRLTKVGSLLPEVEDVAEEASSGRDLLLILAPVLFMLTATLLVIRLFPLLMRILDGLGRLGRQTTLYLAGRQLSRQSVQYSSALLLIVAAMGLGAFMASAALSMDTWLRDQIYYGIGADVLLVQMPRPDMGDPFFFPTGPAEGAWALPVDSYLEIPGVLDAARAALYPAEISIPGRQFRGMGRATYIGLDRADAARVVFYRPDFGPSMGELMNRLALQQDGVLLSEEFLEQTPFEIGDTVRIQVDAPDFARQFPFTIVGAYRYFPTVYEERQGRTAVIGNLDYLYNQLGATLIHNVWLRLEPDADPQAMMDHMYRTMRVYVQQWVDVREEMAEELANTERVGILGTLTIGFIAAAALSTVGLLLYSYASLQEKLFRLTIMRAIGLSLSQVTAQVIVEYVVVTLYGIASGAGVGLLAAWLYTPFFQATDQNVIHPPTLLPMLAWQETGQIAAIFGLTLIAAQLVVIGAALRRGVFQALRMGDRE